MAENLPDTNAGNIEYINKQVAIDVLVEQIALCDKALKSFGISMKDEYAVKVERASLVAYKEQLEAIPAADVAPVVHGRWIWKSTKQYCPPDCWYPPLSCNEETWDEKNGTWLENEMYCSECDYHNYREIKYNFCPNCGAKMDKEE